MLGLKRLVEPTREDFATEKRYTKEYDSYSEYNYVGSRIDRKIKKLHFNKALDLALKRGSHQTVVDFGCADGFFLPSLSSYFSEVFGIERNPRFVRTARELIDRRKLQNTQVFCNAIQDERDFVYRKLDKKADTLFAMEVIEHVGTNENMYCSKSEFIEDLFKLVQPSGKIIISVPVMVGASFLIQRAAMKILGLNREKISLPQFFKCVVLKNTDGLEKKWAGGHLGFNHIKLEAELSKHFNLVSHSVFFSKLYEITSMKKGLFTK